jgi:hypothetical protein
MDGILAGSIRSDVLEILLNNSPRDTEEELSHRATEKRGRASRSGSIICTPYEQISKEEVFRGSMYRNQSIIKNQGKKAADDSQVAPPSAGNDNAVGTDATNKVVSDNRNIRSEDYVIEVPKSGLFDRDEYFTPLFLPTKCEQPPPLDPGQQDAVRSSTNVLNADTAHAATMKRLSAIRSLVYCIDESVMAAYQQAQRPRESSTSTNRAFGLKFDSSFECGNLYKAESLVHRGAPIGTPEEYDLTIRSDPFVPETLIQAGLGSHTNRANGELQSKDAYAATHPCCQWYFFRVFNTKARTYKFNICNFTHKVPALVQGMQPVMISEEAYKTGSIGWRRVGDDLEYYENTLKAPRKPFTGVSAAATTSATTSATTAAATSATTSAGGDAAGAVEEHDKKKSCDNRTYTLSFSVTFEHAKDSVYFAFAPPYTYTQLQNMIYGLTRDTALRKNFTVRPLCRTLAGNRCDIVTITENNELHKAIAKTASFAQSGDEKEEGTFHKHSSSSNDNNSSSSNPEDTLSPARYPAFTKSGSSKLVPPSGRSSLRSSFTGDNQNSLQQGTTDPRHPHHHHMPGMSSNNSETIEEATMPSFLLKMQQLIDSERKVEDTRRMEENKKKAIFVTARTHPGEVAASWMCEGLIKFLLGTSATATELRKHFVFYIVPMLNPDGVVCGMQRSDISGVDLNTQWAAPVINMTPSVYHLKQLVRKVHSQLTHVGGIVAFFDLHVQSTKDGLFFYSVAPSQTAWEKYLVQVQAQVSITGHSTGAVSGVAASAGDGVGGGRSKHHSNSAGGGAGQMLNTLSFQQQQRSRADPRLFYLAAGRRSEVVALRHCSLKYAEPPQVQLQQPFVAREERGGGEGGSDGGGLHLTHGREVSTAGEATGSAAAGVSSFHRGTLRAVMATEFHVPLSMAVQVSCFRNPPSKRVEAQQLVSADYAR